MEKKKRQKKNYEKNSELTNENDKTTTNGEKDTKTKEG